MIFPFGNSPAEFPASPPHELCLGKSSPPLMSHVLAHCHTLAHSIPSTQDAPAPTSNPSKATLQGHILPVAFLQPPRAKTNHAHYGIPSYLFSDSEYSDMWWISPARLSSQRAGTQSYSCLSYTPKGTTGIEHALSKFLIKYNSD